MTDKPNNVTNWAAYQDYQKHGCQEPRETGKSKCGRTDGGKCHNCGVYYCQQHSVYAQMRFCTDPPKRIHICLTCLGDTEAAARAVTALLFATVQDTDPYTLKLDK